MLSLLKKIFGKSEPKTVAPAPVPPPPPSSAMPSIEVAHLSLAAIIERFPEDLRPLVGREPDAAATVALPIPTILKQLPNGAVKMSLASLHRQAQGLITSLPSGDKRSVDVPLKEVFRHIRPGAFRRREQRILEVPNEGFNLFSDSSNPYAVSPDDPLGLDPEPEPTVLDLTTDMPAPAEVGPRMLKMDDNLRAQFGNGANGANGNHAAVHETASRGAVAMPAQPVGGAPAATVMPSPIGFQSLPKPAGETLSLPVASLSAGWPENVRSELSALDPATQVILPSEELSAGLGKGRVNFTWRQIYSWLEPECSNATAVPGDTPLQLPLKVVAPAFLSKTKKPAADRKGVDMDETIPALFSDGRPPEEKPAPPASAPAPANVPSAESGPAEPAAAAPAAEAAPESGPVPPPAPASVPTAPPAPATPAAPKLPESVGQIFGQPDKESWTPTELVNGMVKLPGVAGAVVALQEGLPVAATLPEGVKSDVVAAFLPQIFARLNQYSGEMRLGDVDDLLFTTHGAHCQIYRLGFVYFAVLGKAGEALPWHELHLITEELARQTQK